jgi:hypothetical protein
MVYKYIYFNFELQSFVYIHFRGKFPILHISNKTKPMHYIVLYPQ